MAVEIVHCALHPAHKRQRGLVAVDRGAQHDQIVAAVVGVGAGIADDKAFDKAEVNKPHTGKDNDELPQHGGQEAVQHDERRDEQQRIAPPGIAPRRKAQQKGQRSERGGKSRPVRPQEDHGDDEQHGRRDRDRIGPDAHPIARHPEGGRREHKRRSQQQPGKQTFFRVLMFSH